MISRRLLTRLLILGILVLGFLLASPPISPSQEGAATGPGVAGDVDCSGAADPFDSLAILSSAAGLPAAADCLQQSGDVSCDALIDTTDSIFILRYAISLPVNARDGCIEIGEELPGGAQALARQLSQDILGAETDEARVAALLDVMEPLGIGHPGRRVPGDGGDVRSAEV